MKRLLFLFTIFALYASDDYPFVVKYNGNWISQTIVKELTGSQKLAKLDGFLRWSEQEQKEIVNKLQLNPAKLTFNQVYDWNFKNRRNEQPAWVIPVLAYHIIMENNQEAKAELESFRIKFDIRLTENEWKEIDRRFITSEESKYY